MFSKISSTVFSSEIVKNSHYYDLARVLQQEGNPPIIYGCDGNPLFGVTNIWPGGLKLRLLLETYVYTRSPLYDY